jgi:immune inhibitor A
MARPPSAPIRTGLAVAALLLLAIGTASACQGRPAERARARPTVPAVAPDTVGTTRTAPASASDGGATPVATVAAPTPDALTAALRDPAPKRDLVDLALRMGRTTPPVPRVAARTAPTRAVGEHERFWVHDIEREKYFPITATLRAVSDEAYFWVQDGQEVQGDDLAQAARRFSNEVFPALRRVFGHEWSPGVDGDPRVYVLQHQPIAGVAGYFSSTDEFTTAVEPYSNEHEMFYVNVGTYRPGSFEYLSLLTHELQHMIHWHMDAGEAVWVNEGLSELATVVGGYQQQFGDAFLDAPDTPLTEWATSPTSNAPHYAAAFLFFAWLRAQHGDGAIRAIVASPKVGAAGVEDGLAQVGVATTFDAAFQDWAVANLVDDAVRAGGRYGYGDMGIRRVTPREWPQGGPAETVGQYASDYFDATPLVHGGRLRVALTGDSTVGLLDPVATQPGRVWWSGRSDNGDSRLTRAFDLTNAKDPVLRFKLWHELEENWDYAYFLASTDEGRTWQRLPFPGATDANPNGNNYGRGLTGTSGGWQDGALDLSAYTGQRVLVRFEVVTDDAVSESGVALDDLRLDAVGFTDDAEAEAGWQAEGWVRVDPTLPQRWGLQAVVEQAGTVDVRRVTVTPGGTATVALDDLPADATVTLIVSGLTPAADHPAGYHLTAAEAPSAASTATP